MKKVFPKLMRRNQVLGVYPVSVSTLYERIHAGLFPPPIPLGGRIVGWIEYEVEACINAMMNEIAPESLKKVVSDLVIGRQKI
jgi:prophage regulatory protein